MSFSEAPAPIHAVPLAIAAPSPCEKKTCRRSITFALPPLILGLSARPMRNLTPQQKHSYFVAKLTPRRVTVPAVRGTSQRAKWVQFRAVSPPGSQTRRWRLRHRAYWRIRLGTYPASRGLRPRPAQPGRSESAGEVLTPSLRRLLPSPPWGRGWTDPAYSSAGAGRVRGYPGCGWQFAGGFVGE